MSKLRSRLFLIRTQLSTEDVDENVALVHAARSINEDATDSAEQQAPVDTVQSNAADTPTPPVAAQETTPPQCKIAEPLQLVFVCLFVFLIVCQVIAESRKFFACFFTAGDLRRLLLIYQ